MSGAKPLTAAGRDRLRAFGAEARRRRKEQGLTLEAVGARAKLSANFIGMIEKGTKDASLSSVLKLTRGLGCKPGELFDTDKMSAVAHEVGSLFDAIKTPEERKAVLKLIRAVERLYSKPVKRLPRRRAK